MKRRKDSNESRSRKRKSPATNPFLQLQRAALPASKVNQQRELVLSHALRFSEATRQGRKGQEESNELAETVTFLLEYLERNEELDTASVQSLLSPVDIATMLLQWTVKNLVHASNHSNVSSESISLYWKTLKSCLVVLLDSRNDGNADVSSCLSQSALNKLVPFAARTALENDQLSDTAECYVMLVDRLYRPTMDTACHSLLPLVDKHLSETAFIREGRLILATARHLQILESTVQLIKRLQSTSNPKKVFQLLAEPTVLSSLARWRLASGGDGDESVKIDAAVQELLSEGLFSLLHHADGFRSLNLYVPVMNDQSVEKDDKNRKAFHCYQETLLQTIALLIGESPDDANDDNTVIATALVVPDLLNGLIEMFFSWERDSAAKLKRKGSRDLAPVQFRLWSNMVYPLVTKLQHTLVSDATVKDHRPHVTFVLLQSLRKTLSLVLQHNLYLPSHKDENNVSFSFLKALATILLDVHNVKKESSESISRIESECLQGLEMILRLNHLVVHERLPIMISTCGGAVSSSHQKDLILSIIQTYHRLRQLAHLFRSLLDATDALRKTDGTSHTLVTLNALFLDNDIRQEFGEAVLKCPSSQTKDLFGILNRWIQERCNETREPTSDVSFAVSLYVLLIQNVRVDEHTSADVMSLCDDAITMAVYSLIRASKSAGSGNQELKKEGMLLTGWLVDLKNRCAFWHDCMDEDNECPGLDVVPAILEESGLGEFLAHENVTAAKHLPGSMSHEIQFLLLHRIRELHTAIYQKQRAGLADHEQSLGESFLVDEARRLVNAVIDLAQRHGATSEMRCSDTPTSSSGWKLLAETVLYWTPYSNPNHIEAFLSWVFSTLSATDQSEDNELESIYVAEQRTVAEALLSDASFFEIPEIANQFHGVGVCRVLDLVKLAVADKNKESNDSQAPIVISGLDLTSTCDQYSVTALGDAMGILAPTKLKRFLKGRIVQLEPLTQATQIIRLLNGVPLPSSGKSWGRTMQLDILASSLLLESTSPSVEMTVLSMLCAVKVYVATSMANRIDIVNDGGFVPFIEGFIQSTARVLKHLSESVDKKLLLKASGEVMESLATSCLSVFQDRTEPLNSLIECIRKFLADGRDDDEFALMTICRPLLKRMGSYFQSHSLSDAEFAKRIVSPLMKSIRRMLGASDEVSSRGEWFHAQWLLVNGDATRLASLVPSADSNDDIDLSVVETSLKSDSRSVKRAALYNLACVVASGHRTSLTAQLVLDECLSGPNQLLDATFCGLVREMYADEIRGLLERILNEARGTSDHRLHALHLFHLMLGHVQGEAARSELSKVSRTFFALSCELMRPIDGADLSSWIHSCCLGVSLLITLTENKDIVIIRERDLAFILVQVASVLGGEVTFRKPDADSVDSRVYSSWFMLVSSLLQRFPKQLYACAPTVILAMHALLNHALYGTLADQDIASRAQMVTRLCELLVPHRDVYKKHVLVLILEYVRALRSGMHPSRSKILVPAVYCLLDMITQFETDQLNTMMDTTSKALFRSVYQSHQKTHMYKGQY